MSRYEESIIIHRPLDVVFAYMDDITKESEWQPNIREARQDPAGQPGVGTTRRYVSEFLGKRFENVYVNTVYEPNRRVAYESTAESTLQGRGEIQWQRLDRGTKVTMIVETRLPGLLRLLPKGIVDSASRNELRSSLERLKGRLERESVNSS